MIVGASGAIGSAVALRLGLPGTHLGLHCVKNVDAIHLLGKQLESSRASYDILQESLCDVNSCDSLVDRFCLNGDYSDGMAICSGEVGWAEWTKLGTADWLNILHQHCVGPFFLVRRMIRHMAEKGGKIVFLSSISPKYGGSERTLHYAAAKAALETTMLGLAKQVASLGITINGVRSGFVQTPQQMLHRTPDQLAERVKKIPLGKIGLPDDIAGAFAFLMSKDSDYMTGSIVTVSGGD